MAMTPEEYRAKADAVLVELEAAQSEAERTRLRRAHGVYLKLATHDAEAAERAAIKPAAKIRPERQPIPAARPQTWSFK